VPVRQKDVTASFHPDPSLRPSACAPLRRELYSLGVERCFVVGVTSSSDCQEEKARFTTELALLLAQSGHARVLLIEADFHRPRLHRVLRVEPPEGQSLSEQMHGSASERAVEGWTVLRCMRSLHVLLQGERGTPGLNLSRRFAECIRDVRMHYDFILLDGPAEDSIEDLRALAAFVDGALLVGRAAAQQDLERLAELFSGKRLLKAVRPT
jgi:Mrp family chromosome partitioning ATPase